MGDKRKITQFEGVLDAPHHTILWSPADSVYQLNPPAALLSHLKGTLLGA